MKTGNVEKVREEFERFYYENVKLVYRVLIDRFGNEDGIEDDVQESFVALMESPEKLLSVSHLKDYLIVTAKHISQRRIYGKIVLNDDPEDTPSTDKSIPLIVSTDEFFQRVEERLGHPDYEIVVMRYAYGFTEKEISTRLGIGEDAVHYRCKKGMAKLRKEISR